MVLVFICFEGWGMVGGNFVWDFAFFLGEHASKSFLLNWIFQAQLQKNSQSFLVGSKNKK